VFVNLFVWGFPHKLLYVFPTCLLVLYVSYYLVYLK
jgi:hypothetical protein